MSKRNYRGVEEARSQLPQLLDKAAGGEATVITRHGKPVAALVPLDTYGGPGRQQSIIPLVATGGGLWGGDGAKAVRKLRDEWNR